MIQGLWLAAVLLMQAQMPAPSPAFKVSGTVVREDKRAPDSVPNADRILLRGSGPAKVLDIDTGGAFEFTRVSPGSYEIVIGPMVTMEPVKVVVTDKDVTGLRVLVPDLVSLRGTVIIDGGGPYPRFQMTFTRTDGPDPRPAPVIVSAGTLLAVTLRPGQYRITSSGLANGYNLKSVTLGNADVLNRPMNLESGDLRVPEPHARRRIATAVGESAGPHRRQQWSSNHPARQRHDDRSRSGRKPCRRSAAGRIL